MSALTLRLQKVKCVDETGRQNVFGSDEIFLGGVSIDSEANVKKIKAFNVSGDFDKGETITFSPNKEFVTFDLDGDGKFPKKYFVRLVLFEDDGGKDEKDPFLDKLVEQTKKDISNFSAKGDTLDVIIAGIEKGHKIYEDFSRDEIFTPVDVSIKILERNFKFKVKDGKTQNNSLNFTEVLKEHRGEYHITYDWQAKWT